MIYLNPQIDASLRVSVEAILPAIYFKRYTRKQVNVSPYQLLNTLKIIYLDIPAILPKDFDTDSPGGLILGHSIVCSAGTDGSYTADICTTPDADIMENIMKMFGYISERNYEGALMMVNILSQETKNVVNENNHQIQRISPSDIRLKPMEL